MLKPKSEHSLTKISGRAMYPVSSDDGRNSANGAKIRKRAGKSGFTRRFLGVSLAVLLAASAGSWSQTVYAANSESEEYFQDAKKALKEGKTNEGVIHLPCPQTSPHRFPPEDHPLCPAADRPAPGAAVSAPRARPGLLPMPSGRAPSS